MNEEYCQNHIYSLGLYREKSGIRIVLASKSEKCGVFLYDKKSGKLLKKVSLTNADRIGNVRFTFVEDIDTENVLYQLYENDSIIIDERARVYIGSERYGGVLSLKDIKCGFLSNDYDWNADKRPQIPYENCIVYCLHVRGFTMHQSSGVAHRGTFQGVIEKIPYLKNLGITTVELQPVYEFHETEYTNEYPIGGFCATKWDGHNWVNKEANNCRINYWGYKKGFYYAPKAAYGSSGDVSREFKEMIKAFHKNNMEVVLQFYFPNEVPRSEIPHILYFWRSEYHVDGFRLMGQEILPDHIATDPWLADTKLWLDYVNVDHIYDNEEMPQYRNIAVYNDEYMYDMRRFLKGDNGLIEKAQYHISENPLKYGRINYMTNYYGFTMMDIVSYNDKHNEANGEDNRDGNPYNQSWNCGFEGPCKKKQIKELRIRQYKNAISMLFLSQATPLLFMGDEFGNSQFGNNNPYCQDNEVTWLDWKDKSRNREVFQYVNQMIKLRSAHPILHSCRQMRLTDYYSYGYPDLSFHGDQAWAAPTGCNDRQLGILYCGKYAKINRREDDDYFYIAMNMHWEDKELAMPRLPEGMIWEMCMTTGRACELQEEQKITHIPARTIVIYQSKGRK